MTASGRFVVHQPKEGRDCSDGFRMRLKPDELRMMAVAFGFPAQNFLREQRLTPQRDESPGVEIFWMHGP